jgi:hypothetical protein
MRLKKKRIIAFVVLLAVIGVVNCAPTMPPPPNRVEIVTVKPYPDAVWVAGHWKWSRWYHEWVWVPGHWRRY